MGEGKRIRARENKQISKKRDTNRNRLGREGEREGKREKGVEKERVRRGVGFTLSLVHLALGSIGKGQVGCGSMFASTHNTSFDFILRKPFKQHSRPFSQAGSPKGLDS